MRPGIFVIKSGLVQLEFLSGANAIIEGPAELELSPSESFVTAANFAYVFRNRRYSAVPRRSTWGRNSAYC